MTLYEMLDRTIYYQKIAIFECNAYGQNMPLYRGDIQNARRDEELWSWLMETVEMYEYYQAPNCLVIKVRDERYDERLEKHYLWSDKWTEENRPWLHDIEINTYVWHGKRKIHPHEYIKRGEEE